MLVVRSKAELKKALEKGERTFEVEGKVLHYGLKYGTMIKNKAIASGISEHLAKRMLKEQVMGIAADSVVVLGVEA